VVQVDVVYEGGLRCRAIHGPSGDALVTDAPADNQGRGAAFSPTDLLATALATCIATTMGILAEREGMPLEGLAVRVEKSMVADPLRRVGRLALKVTFPEALDPAHAERLKAAARACPVRRSLAPDVEVVVEFEAR
jgi:putative redox protein